MERVSEHMRRAEGGRIDRSSRLRFRFNGTDLLGCKGDTLASALLANGMHLVRRSVKYHRPRGIFAAGAEEPNALVDLVDGACCRPNERATQVELYDGLEARTPGAWPNLRFDLGALAGLAAPLMAAGFYYKTFLFPRSLWRTVYEPAIRRAAGIGAAPQAADPDRYEKVHAHCDVLVVGGGVAGLAAAGAASAAGARVMLVDEQAEFGGALLGAPAETIDGEPAWPWLQRIGAALAQRANLTVLPRSTVFGLYDDNFVGALERCYDGFGTADGPVRQRLWKIRAEHVVLATGAHERPLLFANNDRPGIMLAASVRAYVNRYAVVPGRRALVYTNNDSAYAVARDLFAAGIEIAAVVDTRAEVDPALAGDLRSKGVEVLTGSAVTRVGGGQRVKAAHIGKLGDRSPQRVVSCDFVAVSGGWNPCVHLYAHRQGRLRFEESYRCFVPEGSLPGCAVVGAAAGVFTTQDCADGARATAAAAVRALGFAPAVDAAPKAASPGAPPAAVGADPPVDSVAAGKTFVDLQTDATAKDVRVAVREGFTSIEHIKRYAGIGLGTDQGKTSNFAATSLCAELTGLDIPAVGVTTYRPPYTPVSFAALAGRERHALFAPQRRTPMDGWHAARGAVFENVGAWRRARYYPLGAEDMRAAVDRECLAVRNQVGIFDSSTLGKIEIVGPDAGEFLERIYTNRWKTLAVGKCRYGLMCRQDGTVFDDGVTSRFADDRYFMFTTTGNAAAVYEWLEEWLQTEWPDLRVYCVPVTDQWASITLSGPKARAVLGAVAPGLDLSAQGFPFMSWREGQIAGSAARVFRISFTGELSYEINIPWTAGLPVWNALVAAGAAHGLTPYGTEALHVLRAEKGLPAIGHDTDDTVTPYNLGLHAIVADAKPFFIGKRSLRSGGYNRGDARQLVGFLPLDAARVVVEGSQVMPADSVDHARPIGHVTSSYFSATSNSAFGLALINNGRKRLGETLDAVHLGERVKIRLVAPQFYDRENARRHG
jgi:sarcosine oxidase subunit alpha